MKVSDFIYKFGSYTMRGEGLCRVRFFINKQNKFTCILTDVETMSSAPSLNNMCDIVIRLLYEDGYMLECKYIILYDEHCGSMEVIDKYGNSVKKYLLKEDVIALTDCEEDEFEQKSMDILSIRKQIEKKRYGIDSFKNIQSSKSLSYLKREFEIRENSISKEQLKEFINSGAKERELSELIKKDLSLISEIHSYLPHDEYIVFSELPIGDDIVDFAIFSGRSTMKVTFIEIKGADFNLKKRGHYDSFNAKIEEAHSQIRKHRQYISNNYELFRREMHRIRLKAELGEKVYNAFLSPKRELLVDPNKNIRIRYIIIAGRTPEDDIEESNLRYQFGESDRDVTLFSWDSWMRRLKRE